MSVDIMEALTSERRHNSMVRQPILKKKLDK